MNVQFSALFKGNHRSFIVLDDLSINEAGRNNDLIGRTIAAGILCSASGPLSPANRRTKTNPSEGSYGR